MSDDPIETSEDLVFEDVMLDIETMSLHPSNALILSIGLLEFDPTGEKLRLGSRQLIRPDIAEQLLLGRHVDPQTQKFWMSQTCAAQDDWRIGAQFSVEATAMNVQTFLNGTKRLWANGIVFDIGNVASLLQSVGYKEPWHYRAPRDMRTFCEHMPERRHDLDSTGVQGTPHAALYDCEVQAYRVWAHWPKSEPFLHHSV